MAIKSDPPRHEALYAEEISVEVSPEYRLFKKRSLQERKRYYHGAGERSEAAVLQEYDEILLREVKPKRDGQLDRKSVV